MNKQAQSSAALPIAHVVLRILVVLNWLMCALVLALLFIAPNREWIISALKLSPSLEADAGFSINGWLPVILTFVLARVFSEGARMRDDLEGTV